MQMSELMVACGYTCTAFMNSLVPVTKCTIWVFQCLLLCFTLVPLLFSFSLLLFGLLNLQRILFALLRALWLILFNAGSSLTPSIVFFFAYFSSPKVLLRSLSFALFPISLQSASNATYNATFPCRLSHLCDGFRVAPSSPCLQTHPLDILAGKTFHPSVPSKQINVTVALPWLVDWWF